MTIRARAYRASHAPHQALDAALTEVHAQLSSASPELKSNVTELARTVHLPVAHLRGALSSFDDSKIPPDAIRVCAGTSCMLAGGGDLAQELTKTHICRPVYCLGYCDRSPVAMAASGKVLPRLSRASLEQLRGKTIPPHPVPPSIRCTSRQAVVTARIGAPDGDPSHTPEYTGLRAALLRSPAEVIEMVLQAGTRGRGGAAYPTGRKWQLAAAAPAEPRFVVANGDEGDPGSFIDRELMERDPHAILEGMAICAHAIGASRGIVFIRSEYPVAASVMQAAVDAATQVGLLGTDALGAGKGFKVEIIRGMGSYVCGEETALLAAIEGQRGEVRPRPPYPVEAGLFGLPTVVDNVETLVNVPWIMQHGAAAYAAMGSGDSKGTKALCFSSGFANPGIVEVEFGVTLREAIESLGGGGADGRGVEAVLLGGPMGSIVSPDQWDVPVCFAAMGRKGINLGHGGLVALLHPVDWKKVMSHLLSFMRHESCGKCVPCRLGSQRVHELAKEGLNGHNINAFRGVLSLMKDASLCAFGRETPGPIATILERFGDRVIGGAAS